MKEKIELSKDDLFQKYIILTTGLIDITKSYNDLIEIKKGLFGNNVEIDYNRYEELRRLFLIQETKIDELNLLVKELNTK